MTALLNCLRVTRRQRQQCGGDAANLAAALWNLDSKSVSASPKAGTRGRPLQEAVTQLVAVQTCFALKRNCLKAENICSNQFPLYTQFGVSFVSS